MMLVRSRDNSLALAPASTKHRPLFSEPAYVAGCNSAWRQKSAFIFTFGALKVSQGESAARVTTSSPSS